MYWYKQNIEKQNNLSFLGLAVVFLSSDWKNVGMTIFIYRPICNAFLIDFLSPHNYVIFSYAFKWSVFIIYNLCPK